MAKSRDFRRKPETGGGWSTEDFHKFFGAYRVLYPRAKGGYELRSKVRLPVDPSEIAKTVKGKDDFIRREEDVEKHGYIAGCPGCRAANRGTAAAKLHGGVQDENRGGAGDSRRRETGTCC